MFLRDARTYNIIGASENVVEQNYYNDAVPRLFAALNHLNIVRVLVAASLIIIVTIRRDLASTLQRDTLGMAAYWPSLRIISTDTGSRALGYRRHYDRLPLK